MSACGRHRADFDAQWLADETFEFRSVTCRCPELQLRVAVRAELQQSVVAAVVQFETRDRLRVAAVEALGKSQHGCEVANRASPFLLEVAVLIVTALRRRLPVVPRDQRDDLDFFRIESTEIAVLDQVVRVLVMAFVADVDADIVQDACIFEPLAFAIGQPVDAPCLVEQHRRESCDLLRVLGPVVAPFGELEHAPSAYIRVPIGLRDLLPMPRNVVEDEAFAQRQVAECDVGRAEPPDDRVQQNAARHCKIGATRLESRHSEPLL